MLNSVDEAIEAAETILPGEAAPDGQEDPRWQAIMLIEDFVEDQPEEIGVSSSNGEITNRKICDGLLHVCY